jgi:hypothetical protein
MQSQSNERPKEVRSEPMLLMGERNSFFFVEVRCSKLFLQWIAS